MSKEELLEAKSKLLPTENAKILISNGMKRQRIDSFDPSQVVLIMIPHSEVRWLITDVDPDYPDNMFGYADLGLGFPEFGSVSFTEIVTASENMRVKTDGLCEAKSSLIDLGMPISVFANKCNISRSIAKTLYETAVSHDHVLLDDPSVQAV